MKTISSRKSEVKSQVGYSQIRNELIETSPTSHRNLCFRVANSEIQLRAQNSLSGSAARLGSRFTKTFQRRAWAYSGTVTDHDTDEASGETIWEVRFDDGDKGDYNLHELAAGLLQ